MILIETLILLEFPDRVLPLITVWFESRQAHHASLLAGYAWRSHRGASEWSVAAVADTKTRSERLRR